MIEPLRLAFEVDCSPEHLRHMGASDVTEVAGQPYGQRPVGLEVVFEG
jgi:hypothetical protein